MLSAGKYGVYKGNTYKVSAVKAGKVRLVSRNEYDLSNGFKAKVYSSAYIYKEKLPNIYIREVEISELESLYEIVNFVIYENDKFNVSAENDESYYIGTGDCELANKHKLNRTDKYYYDKWVPKFNSQLIEEKKIIK